MFSHHYRILPILNKDSWSVTEENFKNTGQLNLYIKNQRPLECGGIADGVNINRNFPYAWNGTDSIGASTKRCDTDYQGD